MKTRSAYSSLAFSFILATVQLSCSGPVIVSGADLPPEQRAEVSTRSGVRIHRIDGVDVKGRNFILAPGTHEIELVSKRDLKKVNTALTGIVDELECTADIDLLPGENLSLSSRLRREKGRFRGGFDLSGFHTEIRLESSIEGEIRLLDTDECVQRFDCSKLDSSQLAGMMGCGRDK